MCRAHIRAMPHTHKHMVVYCPHTYQRCRCLQTIFFEQATGHVTVYRLWFKQWHWARGRRCVLCHSSLHSTKNTPDMSTTLPSIKSNPAAALPAIALRASASVHPPVQTRACTPTGLLYVRVPACSATHMHGMHLCRRGLCIMVDGWTCSVIAQVFCYTRAWHEQMPRWPVLYGGWWTCSATAQEWCDQYLHGEACKRIWCLVMVDRIATQLLSSCCPYELVLRYVFVVV